MDEEGSGKQMHMNPRNHPRGAPPNFDMTGLPPNPRPSRVPKALWWLINMHRLLVPGTKHGGDYVNKPGGHNAGENLKDYGLGDPRTDHSIRRAPDRTGPWWRECTGAEDWTFPDPDEMQKYARRLYNSLKDPKDTRGDHVFQYFLGDTDGDPHIEGWHEYNDADVTGDSTHMWHQHRQYRRNIVGSFPHMWQALTIDMGWTLAEWQRSIAPIPVPKPEENMALDLDDALWDKANPPAWTEIYQSFLAGANPTFRNIALHTLRHAAETGNAVDQLLISMEAVLAELKAITADPASMSDPESHPVLRVVRWAESHPTPPAQG
jgi:hypothetical protein